MVKENTNKKKEESPLTESPASALDALAWEALGLAEFPIVTTSTRRPSIDTYEFEEETTRKGVTHRRKWKMVGSAEYGLPRVGDLDLFVALLVLAARHDYESRVIKATLYELCTIPGLKPGGTTYERIKGAARRFIHTGYSANGVFWPPGSSQPIEVEEWSILAEARLLPTYQDHSIQDGLPPSYIMFGQRFLELMKREGRKPIDLRLWRSLGSDLSKALYHYLDMSMYNRDRFEIGLRRLGNHIGQTGRLAPSQIKRLYEPHLRRFVGMQFLSRFRFEPAQSPDDPYKLVVVPGMRARRKRVRAPGVPRYQMGLKRASGGTTTRNTPQSDSTRSPGSSLMDKYNAWRRSELERRIKELSKEKHEKLLARALAELKNGGRYEKTPVMFTERVALMRVRQALAGELPNFEEWCEASGKLS